MYTFIMNVFFHRQVNTSVKDKSSIASFSLPEDPVMLDLKKIQDEVLTLFYSYMKINVSNTGIWLYDHAICLFVCL